MLIKPIKTLKLVSTTISLFAALLVSGPAMADNHQGPKFSPAEIFLCNYKDGQNISGVNKATAKWNSWMDKTKQHDYLGITLTPMFNDPGVNMDVVWMGFWPDGKSMGAAIEKTMSKKGQDATKDFFKVMNCPQHASFAVNVITAGPVETPDTAVMTFADCKIAEGKTPADAGAALTIWGDYLTNKGITGPMLTLWPAFGGGDVDFDFKMVQGYTNYVDFGNAFDAYGTGGGVMKARQIFGDIVHCNVARLYNMQLRRPVKLAKK
ncbi:MAG: hypothetical protein ACI90U_002661 [Pseudomonadales bacterium]|jgi:hypothetical protein